MAQAVFEDTRRVSDSVAGYGASSKIVARTKLNRLLELETRKRHGTLDPTETRERLQLRSTLRGLDSDVYQEYLSRRDEDPVDERPVGVSLALDVRESSRNLAEEVQSARNDLSALNARRRRIDQLRLGSAAVSNGDLTTLEAEYHGVLLEIDRLQNWLVTLGLFNEVGTEIRYVCARLKRLAERKNTADQLRSDRRARGLSWPRHWEAEYERILSEMRNLEHRASQKKILIAKSRSGGWV